MTHPSVQGLGVTVKNEENVPVVTDSRSDSQSVISVNWVGHAPISYTSCIIPSCIIPVAMQCKLLPVNSSHFSHCHVVKSIKNISIRVQCFLVSKTFHLFRLCSILQFLKHFLFCCCALFFSL